MCGAKNCFENSATIEPIGITIIPIGNRNRFQGISASVTREPIGRGGKSEHRKQHPGEWVALDGDRLIAQAIRAAKAHAKDFTRKHETGCAR